jgi:HEAT repeat protein
MSNAQEHTSPIDDADTIARYVTLLADRMIEQPAIDALVQIGAPAVPALMVAIRERDRWYAATTALARIGTPAIPSLIDLLQHAPFGNFAFHALTEMGTLAVPGLITALAHPHDEVRMWAATAFSYLADVRARDALLVALGDSDWMVRESAVRALGKLGDGTVGPHIHSLQQHDPDQRVRSAATDALTVLEQQETRRITCGSC